MTDSSHSSDDDMSDITYDDVPQPRRKRLSLLIDEKIKEKIDSKREEAEEKPPRRRLSLLIDEKIESKNQKESASV